MIADKLYLHEKINCQLTKPALLFCVDEKFFKLYEYVRMKYETRVSR